MWTCSTSCVLGGNSGEGLYHTPCSEYGGVLRRSSVRNMHSFQHIHKEGDLTFLQSNSNFQFIFETYLEPQVSSSTYYHAFICTLLSVWEANPTQSNHRRGHDRAPMGFLIPSFQLFCCINSSAAIGIVFVSQVRGAFFQVLHKRPKW